MLPRVARLAKYLIIADHARQGGREKLTSQDFAAASRVKPELVRKDMSTFGHLGVSHAADELCIPFTKVAENHISTFVFGVAVRLDLGFLYSRSFSASLNGIVIM